VRIVLGTRSFSRMAGSEAYLLTVAEALERLGHQATIYCERAGEAAGLARRRGIRVERSPAAIEPWDAALAQDAPTAYELSGARAEVPLVFVGHSMIQLQAPPQLEGVCAAAVAMNERIAAHLRAMAVAPELVRLRQPVDRSRFGPLGIRGTHSRTAVAFGNELPVSRELLLRRACERAGFELRLVGRRRNCGGTLHPERELGAAEIVIGAGRCAVEAMAAGKGVYVYGLAGGDGWVTPSSYPALEADGFSGRATEAAIEAEGLAAELAAYEQAMGRDNRDLANAHHDSLDHARELVELWRRLGAASTPPTPAEELARLARVQRQTEETAASFAMAGQMYRLALDDARGRLGEARAELDRLRASRRYRIGAALARPLDALRRRGRHGA
jgi:hypothetical protein